MSPPPVGARVILWAATRETVNKGSTVKPHLVPVWHREEFRGVVKSVDDRWLTMENGDRVRVNDISSWREVTDG